MKIIKCFIDINNTYKIQENSVSGLLKSKNISELWGSRINNFIDTVVIHYISAIETSKENPFDFGCILGIFCKFEVSSHYLIDRNGKIYQLVPEIKKAWHCGGSIMPGSDLRQ
ncbi:MAG: N-acetylmuramoyl-L-alanine amidase, partial [Chitinispirillia bacterium]